MEWLEVVNGPGGALGLLLLILAGGVRGWWVFGRELTHLNERYEATVLDLRMDRDEWKRIALAGTDLAQKAVSAAENAP